MILLSNEELKEWFWSKFDDCYHITKDKNDRPYYIYYDSQIIRQMKLSKLSGDEQFLSYSSIPWGVCVFNKDHEDGHLYLNKILYKVLETNYNYRWEDNKNLINSWLIESRNSLLATSQFGGAFKWESGMYL